MPDQEIPQPQPHEQENRRASVRSMLDLARRDLLDFSLRNNLLNYRPSKVRTVEVVRERSHEVYRLVVSEGASFSFSAMPEQGQLLSDELNLDDATTDSTLQTPYSEKALHARLLAAFYAHRTYIEERGVNILFLALGMLHWYEDDSSEKELRAPLLLIPVTLARSSARERFRVALGDDEIQENLSLASKLRQEFKIEYPELPELEDLKVENYFRTLASAVRGQPRWRVEADEIALSFFSFGKFLMYRDLDVEVWPEDKKPTEHKILNAALIEGFREPATEIEEDEHIDSHIPPERLNTVVDADSSQVVAILDVSNGRNLVIQGPPGTGKSQTITNVIAQGVAEGKRVLFVAEKMAALEVVKRRLSRIGLGEACLELHSNNAHKRTVLAELRRTLELGKPNVEDRAAIYAQFANTRDRLNAYCLEVNRPIGRSGVTPSFAFGRLLRLKEELGGAIIPRGDRWEPSPTKLDEMREWTRADFERRATAVSNLAKHIQKMGIPINHPLRGCLLQIALESDVARIRAGLTEALVSTDAVQKMCIELCKEVGLDEATSVQEGEVAVVIARRLLGAPNLSGINVTSPDWRVRRNDIRKLCEAGHTYATVHAQFDAVLVPAAWTQDVFETRGELQSLGGKWWRFLSGRYRRAVARLAGLCKSDLPKAYDDRLAILDAILEAKNAKEAMSHLESLAVALFGSRWQGNASEWKDLGIVSGWMAAVHADIEARKVPIAFIGALAKGIDRKALDEKVTVTEAALSKHKISWPSALRLLGFDAADTERRQANLSLTAMRDVVTSLLANLTRIQEQIAYNNLAAALKSEREEWVLAVADEWPEAARHLGRIFEYAWIETLLRKALTERSELREFNVDAHEQAVADFGRLDALLMHLNQTHVMKGHWDGLPSLSANGQLGLLAREFEKRSRHLPIRQLIARAGHAIQSIKPVFMMSPLSIASYVPPGTIEFDLVVFDEASQVPPVDAFGAILRGSQVVVVGDSKQLPPTRFFDAYTDDADIVEEEEEELTTTDIESVLGLFCGQGAPQRMLKWHYRSQHESLIAVSNKEFYDSKLVVFPSPQAERGDVGLVFRHLPHATYDRGGTRTNPVEAEAVAAAVIEHTRKCPRLTLGVAAFSIAQMDAIITQLEKMRRADSTCEQFLSAHTHEPFFVKNLETVQGDERDVMFISIGYGRDKEGYFTQGFGALNREGGERRLNVLVTRARKRCEVFSSITDEDIDVGRSRGRGVRALHTFLKYARSGILDSPTTSGRAPDSEFEIAVANALRREGFDVDLQVGSGGFFVDLGIRDPARPGRFLLGIECDGATYHRAKSARDRDRLRQQVLESLGWQLHRIWSTDWFANPERELERTKRKISAALADSGAGESRSGPALEDSLKQGPEPQIARGAAKLLEVEQAAVPKYQVAVPAASLDGEELHRIDARTIARWMVEVVEVESPVHQEEVFRRVVQSVGVQRIGTRVEKALWTAVEVAARLNHIRLQEFFLWSTTNATVQVRDRSELPPQAKRWELVSPQEIGKAIELVVEKSIGLGEKEVASATCRVLGFARVTEEMRVRVEEVLTGLVNDGTLRKSGDQLVVSRNR